jgi:exosortase
MYYCLSESPRLATRVPQLWTGHPPWAGARTADPQAFPPEREDVPAVRRRGWLLMLSAGLALVAATAALQWVVAPVLRSWAAAGRFSWAAFASGAVLVALKYAWAPYALGVLLVALGAWQRAEGDRRAETALRIAGLAVLAAAVGLRWHAMQLSTAYFADISLVGVLLGGILAAFGYRVFRVAWVGVAFILLGIPWPERAYVALAQPPQGWAAMMAERMMALIGMTISREGNILQVLPGEEGKLQVAAACSGLQMLLAFVALSVVYAYIEKRPTWRRVIIFLSAFPIAVVSNFVRVFAMALGLRVGFRQITSGLEHELAGFIIMLPLAFVLLWLEMRVLDGIEKVADVIAGEEPEEPEEPSAEAS